MASRLSVDTTLLIDLQRERVGGSDGPAHDFLRQSSDAELYLSVVALAEFAEGFVSVEHPTVNAVRESHALLPVDDRAALIYSGLARDLRSRGQLIGANDLWIGACSLRFQLPLVTADPGHFGRLEGLELVTYR